VFCFFYIVHAFCYGGSDEQGIDSATTTTGQDIKWQIS